jgi:hypothetical protein
MNWQSWIWASLGLAGCLGPSQVNSTIPAPGAGPQFPSVQGENLEGRVFQLPAGLESPYAVVMIAFLQEQQRVVDTWLAVADSLLAPFPGLRYYEFPSITHTMPAFSRAWLNNGMRAGIPDPRARARTITLYVEKAAFRQALGIPDEQSVHILLTDRAGRIYWRSTGRYTQEQGASLAEALRALPPAP